MLAVMLPESDSDKPLKPVNNPLLFYDKFNRLFNVPHVQVSVSVAHRLSISRPRISQRFIPNQLLYTTRVDVVTELNMSCLIGWESSCFRTDKNKTRARKRQRFVCVTSW